jgi:RNA polymerase sigma-70 factor (ECF subfamily)
MTLGLLMEVDESALRTRASLLLRLRAEPENQGAWKEFVARYAPLIYAWCRHWHAQPADAEDIAQVVLLKLASHLRSFTYDPGRRFRGLLRTLTHHAWSDFVAANHRAIPGSGDSAVAATLNSLPARDDLADRLEKAFDQELLDLAGARVRQRVEPHTWEAFRLSAIGGLSGAGVAAHLGLQVATVFKARSKVQRMLREEVKRLETEGDSCLIVPPASNSKSG